MLKCDMLLQNEAPKILWDFEIQMNHLIQSRRPDIKLIDKKKEHII